MRLFSAFPEALAEIKRDLRERGVRVRTESYQDKVVDSEELETMEILDYGFTVINPKPEDLNPTQPWADLEFEERVSGEYYNPGKAWESRKEVWEQFREPGGGFAYTYPDRLCEQLKPLLDNLKKYPNNRNHVLSIWDRRIDIYRVGKRRVPCSLFYRFIYRQGALHMAYVTRSSDAVTHLTNDLYLACKLQYWVAERMGWPVGRFTCFTMSLHTYLRDLRGVF